jgi:hypothetical protein
MTWRMEYRKIHTRSSQTTLGGSLVTMAWHGLRLQMEGRPPDMEGSCEYIE